MAKLFWPPTNLVYTCAECKDTWTDDGVGKHIQADCIAVLKANLAALAADVGQALCAATLGPDEFLVGQRPHAIVSTVLGLVELRHEAVRRAEVAEARLEVGAAFRALSRASRDVKSGDPAAPGRKAAAHMRLDAAEARVLALGATVDGEGS